MQDNQDPSNQGGQEGTPAPATGTNTPATPETPAVGTAESQDGGTAPDGDPEGKPEIGLTGQPRDGDTVSFGENLIVTFRTNPTEPGEILIGATLEESRDAFDEFLTREGLPFTAKVTDQGIEAEEFEVIDAQPIALLGSEGRMAVAKEETMAAMGVPARMIGQHPDNQRTPDDPADLVATGQRPPEIEVINTPGRVDVIVGGPPTIDVDAEKASAGQPLVEMKIDPSQPGDPGHQQLKAAMENAAQESARLKHAFTDQYPTYLGWFDRVQKVAQFDGRPVPEPTARWKDAYDQCQTPEQAVEALAQRKA